jgi:DNA-binding NtrC family response regulator
MSEVPLPMLADARSYRTPLRVVRMESRVTRDGRPERSRRAPLSLIWRAETGNLARLPLQEELVSVGAHPGNTVVIDDPQASGFHCRLFRRVDGRLWVRDLGSTNGTWVDGMRVSEAEVQPGSSVRVGSSSLRVERDDADAELGSLPGLVSSDPVLRPVIELLQRAAPSSVPILLLGESGCGKEVAARAVHELSARAAGPFVPLNCGAIAPELAESELFGHERGAFTGAVSSAPGAFGAADGGTLFLDEIGDLPLHLQVKLLRALEANEVKPVGAARPRKVDVRFVCATHRDLRARVREGTFREDLYYRLAGLSVELPPLRRRPLDVLPLAERFLEEIGDGVSRSLAPDARESLLEHRWPGNVRELRHVVRLAVLLSDSPVVRASALRFNGPGLHGLTEVPVRAPDFIGCSEPLGTGPSGSSSATDWVSLRGRTLEQLEAMAIRASFERHRGNRRAMMKELGVSKSSLLRKLDLLGLRGNLAAEGESEGSGE